MSFVDLYLEKEKLTKLNKRTFKVLKAADDRIDEMKKFNLGLTAECNEKKQKISELLIKIAALDESLGCLQFRLMKFPFGCSRVWTGDQVLEWIERQLKDEL